MRRPAYDMNVFKQRRQALAAKTQGSAFIIPAHPEQIRNNDVHQPYRQDSNFFYLTGFEEPESVLVFRPGAHPESVLFVRPKDAARETWNGFRYGPEGTAKEFNIDKTYLIEDFQKEIIELLRPVDRIYYRWNQEPSFDSKMMKILDDARLSQTRSGRGYLPVYDSWEVLGEERVIKTQHDIATMRKACELTSVAHIAAMKFVKPGVNERQVKAVLHHSFLMQGAEREGYGTIVASGAAATTLHYVYNDQPCKDGDLLLIDAGGEYEYYTGDITRTFPVNGKFTEPQRRVYEPLLKLEKALIERIKPGITFRSMQDTAVEGITQILIDLGLLKGTRQANIESLAFKKYYPHGVSHFLGLDVHDAGLHMIRGEHRRLEVGMAFTVEPGIYIPIDDMSAPAELRGIGIRIEDNVVVTATGCENLTAGCPKEIAEMEAIIGKA